MSNKVIDSLDNIFGFVFVGGAIAYFTFVVGGCSIESHVTKKYQTEAILYGYAEYVKEPNGAIVWKWKEPKK